jgi:hypothetical protein
MIANNYAWHSAEARLAQERATFTGDPKRKPSRLTIAEIELEPDLFQPRFSAGVGATSVNHIDELTKTLSRGGTVEFEPLIVWWTGRRCVLVDGHHRLAAYRQYSETARGIERGGVAKITVPVVCLTGTLGIAIAASLKGNSRDKLPMSQGEKLQGAWRVVCLGDDGLSKLDIATMSGCSTTSIGRMRKARLELINDGGMKPGHVAGLTWEVAMRRVKGDVEGPDYGDDAVLEARAHEMAMRLSNTFKDTLTKAPEVFARALQIHSPALVMSVVEALLGSIPGMAEHVRAILQDQEQDDGFGGDVGGCGDF